MFFLDSKALKWLGRSALGHTYGSRERRCLWAYATVFPNLLLCCARWGGKKGKRSFLFLLHKEWPYDRFSQGKERGIVLGVSEKHIAFPGNSDRCIRSWQGKGIPLSSSHTDALQLQPSCYHMEKKIQKWIAETHILMMPLSPGTDTEADDLQTCCCKIKINLLLCYIVSLVLPVFLCFVSLAAKHIPNWYTVHQIRCCSENQTSGCNQGCKAPQLKNNHTIA